MKRICILGDSHTAALKAAVPEVVRAFPGRGFTFFAAKTSLTGDARVEDGCLVAESLALKKFWEATSGGHSHIEPRYDHYIICGLGLRIKAAMTAMLRANDSDTERCHGELDAKIESTLSAATLLKLRAITDAPAMLIAEPFPAADVTPKLTARLHRSGLQEGAVTLFRDRMERFGQKHGVVFLPQPKETLSGDGLTTQARYSVGRPYLIDYQGEDDHAHMNAAYGAIVLKAALDLIG